MVSVGKQHVVGRAEEIHLLKSIIHGNLPNIANIYGPGGIGKTVVCKKFEDYCAEVKIPYAKITGDDPVTSTLDKMLYQFRKSLEDNSAEMDFRTAFEGFDHRLMDHRLVNEVVDKGGGINTMYDLAGNLTDPTSLKTLFDEAIIPGKLLDKVDKHFDNEELRTLCFELGVDYENLPAQGNINMIRELILHLARCDRIPDLIKLVKKRRPQIPWDHLYDTGMGTRISSPERFNSIEPYFAHRDELDRYINGSDRWLTESLIENINFVVENMHTVLVLLVDTYEMMEGWDRWMCKSFTKALPYDAKIIILGRDRLNRKNTDWGQYGTVHYHQLQELSEEEAKSYLRRYGLKDEDSLNRVFGFTGGYPLCLMLAGELAGELGWEGVRDFKDPANRDRIASQLLDRILAQEQVKEVQEFLEKGVVARWFDPGAVSYILDTNPERGRKIYDKIGKFSFVQLHPYGLKFHDRVRELLVERLKFMDGGITYRALAQRWFEYFESKEGLA